MGSGMHNNSPCLLSDNEPCYIASFLKQYLCKEYNIRHIHFGKRGLPIYRRIVSCYRKKQSVEELQTIGLGRYSKKYKYTENMLRKEHNLQQRLSHISND